ncbi:OmpP1/FadL family transporter [Thiohalorhabdus sp.]|uniref:OmpP1/FadL family transporter n=1 Tax=Thiohalorhabdus sp. TaxID=3094134 RepID=UPI002FC2AB67
MGLYHKWLVGVCALAAASSAGAAGFELGEQGARPLGSALAGIGSGTDELSAAFWNPAGMAADSRPGVAAGGSVIDPSIQFSGQQPDGGEAGNSGSPPQVFARDRMGKGLVLGFALNAPFGLRTEWDGDWAGRYHAIESDLEVLQGTLSVARQVGNGFSVGGGFVIQQLDVELTNDIKTPAPADGFSRITGDSHGYGWLIGALWQGGDTRLGLSYHSSVVHTIQGTQKRELPAALGAPLAGTKTFSATARLDLPARAVLGVRHDINKRWRGMVSLQWSEWSSYDELAVDVSGGPTASDVTREKAWENAWSFALGTEYDLTDRWTVRGGYRFEQTPVPDAEHRDPRLPDADRHRYGGGASYAWGAGWSLDAAYNYLDFASAKVENTVTNSLGESATLDGSFDSSAQIVSLQVNKRF